VKKWGRSHVIVGKLDCPERRPRNDQLCLKWDAKLYTLTHSLVVACVVHVVVILVAGKLRPTWRRVCREGERHLPFTAVTKGLLGLRAKQLRESACNDWRMQWNNASWDVPRLCTKDLQTTKMKDQLPLYCSTVLCFLYIKCLLWAERQL